MFLLGGSKKTPGSKSANKKDSLARMAVTNRAMSHSETDSPVRPEVLNFQQEEKVESQPKNDVVRGGGGGDHLEVITTPPSVDEHILPPPSTPPPMDKPRQREDW